MTAWEAVGKCVHRCGWTSTKPERTSFRLAVALELVRGGWRLVWDVPVDLAEPDGARIDLVAEREGERVAIEFDRGKPRESSIEKLRVFEACTARVVALRDGHARLVLPRGIDAIATFFPPRLYSEAQPFGYTPRVERRKQR